METFKNIIAGIIGILVFLFFAGIVLAGLPDLILAIIVTAVGLVILKIIFGINNFFSGEK